MADGNEKELVGSIGIPAEIVIVEESIANALRHMARLKEQAVRIPIDFTVVGGGGQNITQALDQAAEKFRFAFQAMGKTDVLQAGLRSLRTELEQIAETAEGLNVSIGGTTTTLKGKQAVAPFIERFPAYAAATTSLGDRTKLGIAGTVEPTDANLQAVGSVRVFTDSTKAAAKAEDDAARITKKTVEEGEKLAKWLQDIGSGRNPRFGIADALRGPMTGMLGETAGSLATGALSILGGAAVFRLGWELTSQLSQIPEKIMQHITEKQALDVARARMANTPAGTLHTPEANATVTATDTRFLADLGAMKQFFTRLGTSAEGETAATTLNTLITKYGGNIKDAQQRADLEKQLRIATQIAEFGHIMAGTGETLRVADALVDMQRHRNPAALQEILNQTGVEQFMVSQERAKQKAGTSRFPTILTDTKIWEGLQEDLKAKLGSWSPELQQQAMDTTVSALENTIANSPNAAAAVTRMRQLQFGKAFLELVRSEMGTKEQLSGTDLYTIKQYAQYREAGWSEEETIQRLEERSTVSGHLAHISEGLGFTATPERIKQLQPYLEAAAGNFNTILGAPAPYQNTPLAQPTFSFSSLANFANKMQTEAGIQIDYPQQSAASLASIDQKMDALIVATANGKEILAPNPALGFQGDVPVWGANMA